MKTIIQLGRYGDILSLLPAALTVRPINWVVNKDYVSLIRGIEGIMVVETSHILPNMARFDLEAFYPDVVVTEVYKNPKPWRPVKNYQHEMWDRLGVKDAEKLPLVLPNREVGREQGLLDQINKIHPVGKVLVHTEGRSSPYPFKDKLLKFCLNRFGLGNVNCLDGLNVNRIQDMCGLLTPDRLLIAVDSAILHLAYATGIPTIALVNDDPWLASIRRPHHIAHIPYMESAWAKFDKIETAIQQWENDHA